MASGSAFLVCHRRHLHRGDRHDRRRLCNLVASAEPVASVLLQTHREDSWLGDGTVQAARISNCSATDGAAVKVCPACPLRIMWTISMPERIVAAQVIDSHWSP
jgi:hypothetical protein